MLQLLLCNMLVFGPPQVFDFPDTTHISEVFFYPSPEEAPDGGLANPRRGTIKYHVNTTQQLVNSGYLSGDIQEI